MVLLMASSRASLAPTEDWCPADIPVGARLAREGSLKNTTKTRPSLTSIFTIAANAFRS
jgi:hypothetical protein